MSHPERPPRAGDQLVVVHVLVVRHRRRLEKPLAVRPHEHHAAHVDVLGHLAAVHGANAYAGPAPAHLLHLDAVADGERHGLGTPLRQEHLR